MLFLLTSVSVYHVETLYTILNPEGSLLWMQTWRSSCSPSQKWLYADSTLSVRITLSIAEIRQKEAEKPPFTSVFIVKDGYYNQAIVKSLLQFTDKHDIVIIFIQ